MEFGCAVLLPSNHPRSSLSYSQGQALSFCSKFIVGLWPEYTFFLDHGQNISFFFLDIGQNISKHDYKVS